MFNIENDGLAKIAVKGEHLTIRAVSLKTSTDNHDTLVTETKSYLFKGECPETEGHIFIISDAVADKATVFIVPSPDCVMPSMRIEGGIAHITTHGYPVSVGSAPISDAERLCRYWYGMQYQPKSLFAMSNTWGDRNGRTRVCDEFIRREIDSGADLGLDVVQVDDGWQTGIPDNFDDDGLVVSPENFWDVKEEIFPDGLEPLADYAKEQGVELGLWFAPESRSCFKNMSRDLSVLKKNYRECGIKYFKLDMLRLVSQDYCERTLDFLDEIYAFGDGISTQLDVTADKRLGYLMSAPYGALFVENRYTAWSNYYPHRTLRNLWSLSRFIPASKFQFELLNPDLSRDKYSDEDPLRPEAYDIDYLFASVMLSNPLFWMETQFLSNKSRNRLKKIIPIWRKYRETLAASDVFPIGEEPNGVSMTGFCARSDSECHLVLFREYTDRKSATYDIPEGFTTAELLMSNTSAEFEIKDSKITVSFPKRRSYAWIRLK